MGRFGGLCLRPGAKDLFLVCRTINKDVTTMLYGESAFHIVILTPYNDRPYIQPSEFMKWQLFFMNLRPSTAAQVKRLDLQLNIKLHTNFTHENARFLGSVEAIIPKLVGLPHMSIALSAEHVWFSGDPYVSAEVDWDKDTCATAIRPSIDRICRRIAGVRSGLWTVWNDEGDEQIAHILQHSVPPVGTEITTLSSEEQARRINAANRYAELVRSFARW